MFKNINYSKGGVRQINKNLRHNGNCEYDETSRKKTKLKMHSFHGNISYNNMMQIRDRHPLKRK